jgi:predicted DNA binding CopG/RHH family protein
MSYKNAKKKDGTITFRYPKYKIEAVKQLAFLESKTASRLIQEAVDSYLNLDGISEEPL